MTTEQWQRVKAVYEDLAGLAAAEQSALLASACADDAAVRAEVEALLQLQPQAAAFLEQPPLIAALPSQENHSGKQIGAYRLLRELGRGGMGAVYLAERADGTFDQQVAIKLVWPGPDSIRIRIRFHQERQILAQLNHPNIARLLDGGTTEDGWPYLVMEYVAGQPITHYCYKHRLSLDARLKLFLTVCHAVTHAHSRLVIHRDLKPSNIFVTDDGQVKLLDFGIAKLLKADAADATPGLTRTGMQLLTPEYASPEQLRASDVTTATDVYSLGVVLYELMAGTRPYQFKTPALAEIVQVVCEYEPEPPSRRVKQNRPASCQLAVGVRATPLPDADDHSAAGSNQHPAPEAHDKLAACRTFAPQLRGDLDQIVLKALRKEPERRYQSSEQLSDDLRRYFTGQPVTARRGTLHYRAAKFVKRNKVGVAVGATLALVMFVALGYAVWQTRQARAQARQQRRELYVAQLPRAAEDWERGNLARMNETLARFIPQTGEEELRGFEWYYLWRLSHRDLFTLPHDDVISGAAFSDGGRKLFTISERAATMGEQGDKARTNIVARSWDLETGRELRSFSLDQGRTPLKPHGANDNEQFILRSDEDHTIRLWDFQTGRLLTTITDYSAKQQWLRFYLGDWQMIIAGFNDGTVKVWNPTTTQLLAVFGGHAVPIRILAGKRDGKYLAVVSKGGHLKVWDQTTRTLLATLREADEIENVQINPDEKWLFYSVGERTLKVLETKTFSQVAVHTEAAGKFLNTSLLEPGNRVLTCSTDRTAKIWELPHLRQVAVLRGHNDWVWTLLISPDHKFLATGSSDGTARLWDNATHRELAVVRGHTGEVGSVGFDRDSRRLQTVGNDRTIKIWDVATLLEPDQLNGHTGHVFAVAFSPDGQRLATASEDGTAKIWDIKTGHELATLRGHTGQVFAVAYSPDGRLLATCGEDKTARLWDAQTGRALRTLTGHRFQMHELAFAPDGRTLATASDDDTVKLWDVATGHEQRTIPAHSNEVQAVAFSPDGRRLATGGVDQTIKLWDAATGQQLATLTGHTAAIWSLQFTRDGQRLVSGSRDKTAKLWDFTTGRALLTFQGHFDEIFSVAISPDGQRLATGSNDKTIRLWNVATGQELLTLQNHTDQVWSVAFSPDGRTLASGSWDDTARLWRAATELEVKARFSALPSAKK